MEDLSFQNVFHSVKEIVIWFVDGESDGFPSPFCLEERKGERDVVGAPCCMA